MKKLFYILLVCITFQDAFSQQPIYANSTWNVGTFQMAWNSVADSCFLIKKGRIKGFNAFYWNKDSLPILSAIGSGMLQSIDTASGQFKRILPSSLGFVTTNIYSANGNLSSNRIVGGTEVFDMRFTSIDTFEVQGVANISNAPFFPANNVWKKIQTVTINTTLNSTYSTVLVDCTAGDVTITLPTAAASYSNGYGLSYIIVRLDGSANAINIVRSGSDTINGATTVAITPQYGTRTFQSAGGTAWYIAQ